MSRRTDSQKGLPCMGKSMRISDLITRGIDCRARAHRRQIPCPQVYGKGALGARSGVPPDRIRRPWPLVRRWVYRHWPWRGRAPCLPARSGQALRFSLFACEAHRFRFNRRRAGRFGLRGHHSHHAPAEIASESLANLAAISRLLRDKDRTFAMRKAVKAADIYDVIVKQADNAGQPAS